MQGKIVITVIGDDKVGIVSEVSLKLKELKCNIIDISQTIFENEIFAMIMLVEIKDSTFDFNKIKEKLKLLEEKIGVKVYVQHEDIFKAMHKI
ncbi:ACT domain-containing protein [Hypnocyclicus thermotrophus]|uniref:UPF0237 protein EV215_0974 n=1 Tax=Hypnocyclicus thermotrophus TaxID=1627895 RepID=A0AA46I634_9FUSO|nr:ACT domain-containing protein [Hypnocyclicus thermotrophus]TDT71596.1 ACT domain-containing protein [Hypnocyclicus thermotrophus]